MSSIAQAQPRVNSRIREHGQQIHRRQQANAVWRAWHGFFAGETETSEAGKMYKAEWDAGFAAFVAGIPHNDTILTSAAARTGHTVAAQDYAAGYEKGEYGDPLAYRRKSGNPAWVQGYRAGQMAGAMRAGLVWEVPQPAAMQEAA